MGLTKSDTTITLVTMRNRTALGNVRQRKGLSQSQLAGLADVSRETINRIERRQRALSAETAISLADALDVPLCDLLPGCRLSDGLVALVRGLRLVGKAGGR